MMMEILEYLGMALVGGLLLVLISKFGLQHIIRRDCYYYESKEISEENQMLKKAGIKITDKTEGTR